MSLPTHTDPTMPTTHLHCPNCGAGFIEPADGPGSDRQCWHCRDSITPTLGRWHHPDPPFQSREDVLAGFMFTLQPHESMKVEQYGEFIRYVEQARQENPGALLSFTVWPRKLLR